MQPPRKGPVPPTYDLRVLGEGLAIYEQLDRLVDRFLDVADAEVAPAFEGVPAFAARATAESGRALEWYRRTSRERYLAELLAAGVMNRQFWPGFVERRDTVLLIPDCLRDKPEACQREETPGGMQCVQCNPDCLVGAIAEVAKETGAGLFFAQRERGEQFRAIHKEYPELSVVGLACIWMLAKGMRDAEEARIPCQGVLLNYSACEHWADPPFATHTVVDRMAQILRAKARCREGSL